MDHKPESIAVVLGTRPEIVNLAQIISLLVSAARTIHTGQTCDPAFPISSSSRSA